MYATLKDIFANQSHRKPWQFRNDGDLWQVTDNAIRIRGRNSVDVSWVKGHATILDLISQRTTPERCLAN